MTAHTTPKVSAPACAVALVVMALAAATGFVLSTTSPELPGTESLTLEDAVDTVAILLFGVLGAVARFGWSLSDRYAWAVPGGLVMLLLLLNDDLRGELFELGAGPWMNIPMFTVVAAVYGWVTMRVVARLDSRRRAKGAASPIPASQGVAG